MHVTDSDRVIRQKDVTEVSSTVIRTEADKYAKEQVASQQAQFREFGVMSGWTNDTTYRTLGKLALLARVPHEV